MADLENHSINKVLARKGAETQRFYPQFWISPPLWIPKNQRVFSVIICVKRIPRDLPSAGRHPPPQCYGVN
jgi:hypothetical protein